MTEEQLKKFLQDALQELGVASAGTREDPLRWSGGDLGTDLAPLLLKRLEDLD